MHRLRGGPIVGGKQGLRLGDVRRQRVHGGPQLGYLIGQHAPVILQLLDILGTLQKQGCFTDLQIRILRQRGHQCLLGRRNHS